MAFLFPKNMIFFYWRKMKGDLSQKDTWKDNVFCMLVKVVFLFPTNMKLPFCQKSKDDLFPTYARKDGIYSIPEKDNIHPRKDDIGIHCTFLETF